MFGHDDQQQTTNSSNAPVTGAPVAATNSPMPTAPVFDTPTDGLASDAPVHHSGDASDNDALLNIKQDALKQLSPLVSHLDQSPEEKFRTTMMMIQAADDQSLVKDAYEAAQNIVDEKARAQALLDIINEINYFTQH